MKWSLKTRHTSYASLHYLVKRKCQETSDNLKEMSHLTINFNLILMIVLIFVTVNIYNILLWLNAAMEIYLHQWSMTFWITLSSTPAMHQSEAASNPSRPALLYSLLNYDPDFVVNWIEVRAVRRPQIWKFIGVTMISEIIALLEWRQQMMHKLFS